MAGELKTMWQAKGKVTENDGLLSYKIPTFQGQSGSPILKRVGKEVYIVGIHNRGVRESNINVGLLLT